MIVVTKSPVRGLQFSTAEALEPPPWDVAMMGARLLRHGAEVRVLDQDTEQLAHRVVRRELKNWCPDLVLLYAGGSLLANNPVPDARNLSSLLTGWDWPSPVLACGPLATHYGHELLSSFPTLTGLMLGPVGAAMAEGFDPDLPGVSTLVDGELRESPVPDHVEDCDSDVMPAWHLFSLDTYAARCAGGLRTILIGRSRETVRQTLDEVRHAVGRGSARRLIFDDRDLGSHMDLSEEVARGMFSTAPGVDWVCRVQAAHVTPAFVLALSQGGCKELLISSPVLVGAPGFSPMDDPSRPRLESAVEAVRVTGMSPVVLHQLGLQGQTRSMLSAWQRWFADRNISVCPEVRVQHTGGRGEGKLDLSEAFAMAGCWDNELSKSSLERAVKVLRSARSAASQAR